MWLRNRLRVVFLPEIEELCDKGQVNQKSCIIKFDQTKKLHVLVLGGEYQIIISVYQSVLEKLIMHLHVKANVMWVQRQL